MPREAPTGPLAASFVSLLRSPLTLVAVVAFVAALWLPYLHHSNASRSVGEGTVLESILTDKEVVELDTGLHTVLDDDEEYDAGDRVTVYDSYWSDPTGYPTTILLWVLTVILGAIGLVVFAWVFGSFASMLLEGLAKSLESACRRLDAPKREPAHSFVE